MKHDFYFYRKYLIVRKSIYNSDNSKGWVVIDKGKDFKTLNEAKNYIDKIEGGFVGRCEPKRHFLKNSIDKSK